MTEKWKIKLKQGRPGFGVDMKITDDKNAGACRMTARSSAG